MSAKEFKEAAEKVIDFVVPAAKPTGEAKELRYSKHILRQLVVNDLNARGIDIGVVRVDFDDLGAIINTV